jgi:hypothetical protein
MCKAARCFGVAGAAIVGATVLLAACGDRTGLVEAIASDAGSSDVAMDVFTADVGLEPDVVAERCPPPSCPDNTRGTFRLETEAHELAGWLFLFDGRVTCNYTTEALLLSLPPDDGGCNLAGPFVIREDTENALRTSSNNLGGIDFPKCGGDPSGQILDLDLTRVGCSEATYDLTVHDSRRDSPFDMTVVATRCRCAMGWDPCATQMPSDPCSL